MRVLVVLALALAQEGPSHVDLVDARERERVARLELEAARAKGFYFVADAAASTLVLKLSGVPLASYAVESMELGRPLIAGPDSEGDAEGALEPTGLYTCTSPPPPPVEIVPGPPPAPTDPASDDSQEKDLPRRAVFTCDPPLSVHLVSTATVLGIRERLRFGADRAGELRMRLVIAEPDAERLFASVPQNARFVFSRAPEKPPEATEARK